MSISKRFLSSRSRLPLATLFALVLTIGFAVLASAIELGNVDGVWGSPTPSNTTAFRWCFSPGSDSGPAGAPTACNTEITPNPGASIQSPPHGSTLTDENQVRFGSGASLAPGDELRSGYGFNGNDDVGVLPINTPFYLGRFTHYNRPVSFTSALTSIPLNVTVSGIACANANEPTEGDTLTFSYTFVHDETPNDPGENDGGVCPWGNTGGNGCNDLVTVANPQPTQTFTCPGEGRYTLTIRGFYTNANCHLQAIDGPSYTFTTAESTDNPACLWAEISAPQAIELNAFDAQWADGQVEVMWETVSETDNLGFNLYRSASETELGERLNAEMIPAQASGSSQGALYDYTDSAVTAGVTYWYTLEDVDTSGGTSLHGPVAAGPDVPTAVTLGTVSAQSGNGGLWIAVGALLALAGTLVARRRNR